MNKIRVASLQYYLRPVSNYKDFESQVSALIETAMEYKVHMVVFPEYFSTQLLTIGDVTRPVDQQIRDLAAQEERTVETLSTLAKKHGVVIVGGTIPGYDNNTSILLNKSYVFSTSGKYSLQAKLHMTRFESEEWLVSPGKRLRLFEGDFGKFAVAICYDVEFPEIARAAARLGARFLVVPSCTDDRQGYLRVRYCGQARAIENQMYVIHSPCVGSIPMVPAVSLNYGQAAIYTPSDFSFSRDGILAEGPVNQESMVIGDLNLSLIDESRNTGTVLPLRDSRSTADTLKDVDHVKLD